MSSSSSVDQMPMPIMEQEGKSDFKLVEPETEDPKEIKTNHPLDFDDDDGYMLPVMKGLYDYVDVLFNDLTETPEQAKLNDATFFRHWRWYAETIPVCTQAFERVCASTRAYRQWAMIEHPEDKDRLSEEEHAVGDALFKNLWDAFNDTMDLMSGGSQLLLSWFAMLTFQASKQVATLQNQFYALSGTTAKEEAKALLGRLVSQEDLKNSLVDGVDASSMIHAMIVWKPRTYFFMRNRVSSADRGDVKRGESEAAADASLTDADLYESVDSLCGFAERSAQETKLYMEYRAELQGKLDKGDMKHHDKEILLVNAAETAQILFEDLCAAKMLKMALEKIEAEKQKVVSVE